MALLVVLLLGLGACSTAASTPVRGETLRVMTWNVQGHTHEPDDWADLVAQVRPDVLAVQEICTDQAAELGAILRRDHGLPYTVVPAPIRPPTSQEANAPINAALGPVCGTDPDAVEWGLAVLSLLPVGDDQVVLYPPDRRDEQRGYLGVRVAGLRLVTTHIGLNGVQADQIRLLADAATGPGPVVLLGDLNVGPGAPELAPLRAAFTEVDPAGELTTTARGKIDYIFHRGLAVVGGPETPEVTASDHRPLVATLVVAQ
ncbi:endonuclease/exonuclease/phosphatase family protein [Actinomycetospora cinnamomea]|uniref:Endonuclease/exonuclease/phosphatase family metal-dependent hydrolase n=1 Tax=Actinomycetospora cinnamomea TaxID=663609 RepID=A0A2U1FGF6_9PSEU|nr:endonuclease/exonuclease/phosphatase family protein [Actinomycetospora cinnamomea]PVZ11050.1 endonuclease/exonuclease/phosphatase family metal-dependent hydrolase [Actinomycetospora cinnamomea]